MGAKGGGSFKERMVLGVQCSEMEQDEGCRASMESPSTTALPTPPLQTSEWCPPSAGLTKSRSGLNSSVAAHCLQNKVHTPSLEFQTLCEVASLSLSCLILSFSSTPHTYSFTHVSLLPEMLFYICPPLLTVKSSRTGTIFQSPLSLPCVA